MDGKYWVDRNGHEPTCNQANSIRNDFDQRPGMINMPTVGETHIYTTAELKADGAIFDIIEC